MSTSEIALSSYEEFPFSLDDGIASRAGVGLIVLATDQTIEYEWRQLLDQPGIAFFESRIHNSPQISPDTLALMEQDISSAVELILPDESLKVMAFGCTSGTMVIGEENIFKKIHSVRPNVACTTPLTGAMAALKALNAERIALLTPYIPAINHLFADFIEKSGINVSRIGSFNNSNDNEVARIDRQSLQHAVQALGNYDDVDAVFISCTSLRVAELIPALERALGKPVISSNYAMAWHALRLAGIEDIQLERGTLFTQ